MKRFLFLIALASVPALAFAQGNTFVPLTSLPGITDVSTADSLAPFLSEVYKLCIGAAAVLAVLQIMRAGVLYMGGDSFTEKKEAKNLIGVAIAGLILVLSPVIIFSIINPDILNLDINVKGLTPSDNADGSSNAQIVPPEGDGSCSTSCASGFECKAGKCVESKAACTPIKGNTVITEDQISCCKQQPGYDVKTALDSNVKATYTCVAPAAPKQPVLYGWSGVVTKPDGSGRTTAVRGGFTSKQACQADVSDYMVKNNLTTDGTFRCVCDKPLSQQSGCNF